MNQLRISHLLLTCIAFFAGCEKAELATKETPTLPVNRTVTDIQGRTIETTIVSRSESEIVILKLPGNTRHVIPIDRLSIEDQSFALSLAISEKSTTPAETKKPESRQRKLILSNLEEIYAEIEELNSEIQELPRTTIRAKSLKKQVERLKEEAADFEKELFDLD